jgi:hypothetical protein
MMKFISYKRTFHNFTGMFERNAECYADVVLHKLRPHVQSSADFTKYSGAHHESVPHNKGNLTMNKIVHVTVHLDDDMPEDMLGVVRCGSVTSEGEDGNELKDHQELIDNTEFDSEEALIAHVAKQLGVSPDAVTVEA